MSDGAEPEEARRRRAAAAPATGEGLDALVAAIGDPSWRVRKAAAARVAQAFVGPKPDVPAADVATRLVERLATGDAGARSAAAEALALLGGSAKDAIASAFGLGDARVRRSLLEVLIPGGLSAVGLVLARQGLSDSDANVRVAAVETLARLDASGSVATIVGLLADRERLVRYAALEAIPHGAGTTARVAVERLVADPLLERPALRALGRIGDAACGPALAGVLTTSSAAWRDALAAAVAVDARDAIRAADPVRVAQAAREGDRSAIEALGIAQRAEHAALLAGIAAAEPDLAGAARAALGRLGTPGIASLAAAELSPEELEEAARAFAEAPAAGQGAEAIDALAALEARAPAEAGVWLAAARARRGDARVAGVLAASLRGDSEASRAAADALAALSAANTAGAAEVARTALSLARGDESGRAAAADLFGAAGDSASLSLLARDPSALVRRRALGAIGRLEGAGALTELSAALSDEDGSVRAAAVFGLSALGAQASSREAASREVARALVDRDLLVRVAAVRALGSIGGPAALDAILGVEPGKSPLLDIAVVEAIRRSRDDARVRDRLLAYAQVMNPDIQALAHAALVDP